MQIITDFMNADHARIDELWADFLVEKNNLENAQKMFSKFYGYIVRHMDIENKELFPRFDKFVGFEPGKGPTIILQHDHATIGKFLTKLKVACDNKDTHLIGYISDHLQKIMISHRERENKLEYPILDRIIDEQEWQGIMKIYHLQF